MYVLYPNLFLQLTLFNALNEKGNYSAIAI